MTSRPAPYGSWSRSRSRSWRFRCSRCLPQSSYSSRNPLATERPSIRRHHSCNLNWAHQVKTKKAMTQQNQATLALSATPAIGATTKPEIAARSICQELLETTRHVVWISFQEVFRMRLAAIVGDLLLGGLAVKSSVAPHFLRVRPSTASLRPCHAILSRVTSAESAASCSLTSCIAWLLILASVSPKDTW